MNFEKIKGDIKALSEKKFEIVGRAEAEGRDLTPRESDVVAEMDGAISGLRKQLEQPGQPLTVQGNSGYLTSNSDRFRNFGEQMQAIARAGNPSGQIDPRLYAIRAAATGLGETVQHEGGFMVQADFNNELLRAYYETSTVANLCRRIQVGSNSNSVKINLIDETSRASTRFGGTVGYWTAEAGLKIASKPKFRQLELILHKVIGLCYATDELLADATLLQSVLMEAFSSELRFQVNDAIINGSGVAQPLGVLNSGALVSVSAEAGQHVTVISENIFKMWSRLLPGSERTAVWLVNKSVLPQLYSMSVAVGTGGSAIYLPANAAANQPYQTLMGRPVIPCEYCPVLGTVGDIILGDFTNGYVLAEKGGIETAQSLHVQFVYDESVFRWVYRIAGAPVLASAITPYKGGAGNSQSYFIALATRT